MSIPGLGQIVAAAVDAPTVRTIALRPFWEWRFDIAHGSVVKVKLTSGTAERDGTELALHKTYALSGTKAKLLTWHGCTLDVDGPCDDYVAEHVASDSPMVSYLNLHLALQARRDAAASSSSSSSSSNDSSGGSSGGNSSSSSGYGPRVMVCGPHSSGKSSLARTLVAWATRLGEQPVLVNVDPSEGMLSLPGTLSAAVFGSVMDVEDPSGGVGVGGTPSSGPSATPVKLPLVHYLGRAKADEDVHAWKDLVARLAAATKSRFDQDDAVRSAGIVVDTPAVPAGKSDALDLLVQAVQLLDVNIVVVLSSARINVDLQKRLSLHRTALGEPITVLTLEKSEGVVERDSDFLQATREAAIKEYFFGDPKRTLGPVTQSISCNDIVVFKIPEDAEYMGEPQIIEQVDVSSEMSYWTLAVMNASVSDPPETIQQAPVLGFISIADVDDAKKRLKILSPVGGRLGDHPLVWGRWPEPYINLLG